jgi:hypothetical protein
MKRATEKMNYNSAFETLTKQKSWKQSEYRADGQCDA